MSNSGACNAAPTLIFACSGAADVGALADQAARRLTREGAGNMFCLAGIGGRVSGIVKSTEAAAKILVIDGCPLDCARKCLEQAEILGFQHLQLAELGFQKGQSPVDEASVRRAVEAGRDKLAGPCCP